MIQNGILILVVVNPVIYRWAGLASLVVYLVIFNYPLPNNDHNIIELQRSSHL